MPSVREPGPALPSDQLADQLVDRATAASDDQRGAHGREHERPEEGVAETEPDRLRNQQHAEGHRAERQDLDQVVARAIATGGGRRGGRVVGGEEQPAGGVEHDAGAARERQHDERQAHEVRFDAEVVADAAGHAGQQPIV